MHRTRRWTGLRTAAIALGLGLLVAPHAGAATINSTLVNYSTAGSVQLQGITGKNVVSFKVASGSFQAPSAFSLGEFLVDALPSGESTTYNNTPFSISYLAQQVDGSAPDPNETPVTLTGVLNGTFTGPDQSSVVAKFNPVSPQTFTTGNFINTLDVLGDTVSLVPSTTNGGRTTVQAQVLVRANPSPAPVPEPASLAVFLTAAAGLVLRRRLRAKAKV